MTKAVRNFYLLDKGIITGVLYLTNKNINRLKQLNKVLFNIDNFYIKLNNINNLEEAKIYQKAHIEELQNYVKFTNSKSLLFDVTIFYNNINQILNPIISLSTQKKKVILNKLNSLFHDLYSLTLNKPCNPEQFDTNEENSTVFSNLSGKPIISKEKFDCVIYADASYSNKNLSQCMITIKDKNKKYYYDIIPDIDSIMNNFDDTKIRDVTINEFLAIYYSLLISLNLKKIENKKICILNDNLDVVRKLSLLLNNDKDFTYYHLLNNLKEFLAKKIFKCNINNLKDEFVISFYDLINKYSQLDITFSWIKGHEHCFGNIIADSIKNTIERKGQEFQKKEIDNIPDIKF